MADTLLEKIYGEDLINWDGGYDLQEDNEGSKHYIAALGRRMAAIISRYLIF